MTPLVPPPPAGARTHAGRRLVRLGDVRPSGRARLDAVARWLQDVAADDVRDAGADDAYSWVVRRTRLEVRARPSYEEPVELVTWCSATGAAWAERRTTVTGAAGPLVEAAALWVSLDPATMRPTPLRDDFAAVYGPSTAGRRVRGRLLHEPEPPPGAEERRWWLRDADFDLMGHVNNAVAWAALDEELRRRRVGRRAGTAEVEYRAPIDDADHVRLVSAAAGDEVRVWLVLPGGEVAVTAVATAGVPAPVG